MNNYIVVNATALDGKGGSGAVSILKQFIQNVPSDELNWLVFVSDKFNSISNNNNVKIEPISGVKPMLKRFWWDSMGLNRWLKKNNIKPIATISLQNTGFRVSQKGIPSFIYLHQPVPFFPYSWNPLKKNQRNLWFYKHIYPFFIRLFLKKDTTIFVQLQFIKDNFIKKFNHRADRVAIYSPSIAEIKESESSIKLDKDALNLFYPATPQFYKNQKLIVDTIGRLNVKANLYLTTNTPDIYKNIEYVKDLGVIPFSDVCAMYSKCDALLFPSYIETFGLPLLEAALTGMPIIAVDLPFAREVLDGYEGVTFVKYDSIEEWVNAINKLKKGQRYTPIDISKRPGWKDLFFHIRNVLQESN